MKKFEVLTKFDKSLFISQDHTWTRSPILHSRSRSRSMEIAALALIILKIFALALALNF